MSICEIIDDEVFRDIELEPLQQIVPLLVKVGLPVSQQGVVDAGFIAQLSVTQKMMDIHSKLMFYKLQHLILWVAENPCPTVGESDSHFQGLKDAWKNNLCKHLHEQVNKFAKEIFDALQGQQAQQRSKLIVPGQQNKPGILKPR